MLAGWIPCSNCFAPLSRTAGIRGTSSPGISTTVVQLSFSYLYLGGPRVGEFLPRSTRKTHSLRPTGAAPRVVGLSDTTSSATSLLSSGQARRRLSSGRARPERFPTDCLAPGRICQKMPPAGINLQRLPLAEQGSDSNAHVGDSDSSAARPAEAATGAVGVHVGTRSLTSSSWLTWPLAVLSNVPSMVRGWFASLDAVLLEFPRGVGPAISALIRLLSFAIAASIISSIVSKTTSSLLRLSSGAPAGAVDPYTPGRHSWVAVRSRWDPHHCSICSGAIAWVSDSEVRCQICGSHAHAECSKRAHREGFACKTLCSSDVEVAHRRLFNTQGKSGQEGDDESCGAGPEDGEKKAPPVMRHQWMRGSIDDSRPCSGCGGHCAGSGGAGQRGFSCAWCKQQVHEGCVARVSEAACSMGRHRRLILPPIAVLKDLPRRKRKGDMIREAVSKVRGVLPRQNDSPTSPPYHDHNQHHPTGPAPTPGSGPQRGFVGAVRGAAAAVAAAATEVEHDVADRVRGAVLFRGEDGLWEEAFGDAGWPKEGDEFSAKGSSADFPVEAAASLEVPGGMRSTSLIDSGKGWARWSKGLWTPAYKRRSSSYDGMSCDSSGRGGVEGWRVTADDGRGFNNKHRRWHSESDKTSKRPITAGYSSVGEEGSTCELPVGELETRTRSELNTTEAGGLRSVEQAQPKPLACEPDGETISSEYTTVEAGVLKPVSVDGFASRAERGQKEGTPGEPSLDTLAARDDSGVVDVYNDRSWRGECDDGRVDGGGPELRENEAREGQEEQEDEEKEWVVKMQELLPRHQTSGEEGSDAAKAVGGYTRKTRYATLTICEDKIPEDSCPLMVFVNSKSGGKQGGLLVSRFRELLNPLQVSDLSSEDPLEVLHRFRNVRNLRLLVCGGDGTVAWVLQAVDAISWKDERPPLAILPLGTGNDLARVLGWGSGYAGEGLQTLLDTIEGAQVSMLDRWSVSVSTAGKGAFRKTQRSKDRQIMMNNYIGIGVDGQVALDFHKMRESRPLLFFNRAVNKVLYAQLGVRSFLARAYRDLPARLELRCDGRRIELPETTASIVALNINSFSGGSKLWAVEETEPSRGGLATGKVANDPLNFPSSQHANMWAFNVSEEFNANRGSGDGSGSAESIGFRQPAGELHPSGELSDKGGESDARESDGVGSFISSSEGGEFSDEKSEEGVSIDTVRPGRLGSASIRRESKTSFHDGLLEVVAVEGVLHFGQIHLGLSSALPVAQCREVEIRTFGTLPMQVDGEPWTQPASEITVKMHNQAAMLRPATATERAVASVLSDVDQAIDGAQEDLVINERQARALMSRIRRTARIPDGLNDDD